MKFYRIEPEGKLVIGLKKASVGPSLSWGMSLDIVLSEMSKVLASKNDVILPDMSKVLASRNDEILPD